MFFLISTSITEAAAVAPNEARIFSVNGTVTFINGPANSLNNEPRDRMNLEMELF